MSLVLMMSMLLLQAPDSVITRIGIDQQLGAVIDPAIEFHDETGNVVKLGDFMGQKPIILTPVYFDCPMLCSLQLNGLVRAMRVMPFTAGREFEIVTFSIDPNEGPDLAAAKKQQYVHDYGKPGVAAGWHFLTGDAESIRKLTGAIGFRYTYDEATHQWAHVSAVMVLTPAGRVSQYFYGIEHDPADLKYSLIEASSGKIGSFIDHAVLFCYQYDPLTGKYSLMIMRVMRLAGVGTVIGIVMFMVWSRRRDKDKQRSPLLS